MNPTTRIQTTEYGKLEGGIVTVVLIDRGLLDNNMSDYSRFHRRHRIGAGDSESTSPEIEDFWCANESLSH